MFRKWEEYRALWTEDFATRCLADTEAIMNSLADAAGLLNALREHGAENPIWERTRRRNVREL